MDWLHMSRASHCSYWELSHDVCFIQSRERSSSRHSRHCWARSNPKQNPFKQSNGLFSSFRPLPMSIADPLRFLAPTTTIACQIDLPYVAHIEGVLHSLPLIICTLRDFLPCPSACCKTSSNWCSLPPIASFGMSNTSSCCPYPLLFSHRSAFVAFENL